MRKICVISGYRSDYTKLKSVILAIDNNNNLKLQLVVVGSHFFTEFGNTLEEIENDGFKIDEKVNTTIKGNTPDCMAMSIGFCITQVTGVLTRLKPDVVVLVGDRYEVLGCAVAAATNNIPIAHIQGGEVSGTIDESYRHAITKLSHIHFPSTQKSAERIIKMGENPKLVFNVGCPSIDYVSKINIEDRQIFLSQYNRLDSNEKYIVILQHPVTTECENADRQMEITLEAVHQAKVQAILLHPNSDSGHESINRVIRKYEKKYGTEVIKHSFYNVSQNKFYNFLAHSSCLIGNSSSGIREAFLYGVPAINIGTRQQGRERTKNVIDVPYDKEKILEAILEYQDKKFPIGEISIYGNGWAGNSISYHLNSVDLKNIIQKRLFY